MYYVYSFWNGLTAQSPKVCYKNVLTPFFPTFFTNYSTSEHSLTSKPRKCYSINANIS